MLEASPALPIADHQRRPARGAQRYLWLAAAVIFLIGIILRVAPSAGFKGIGFDETFYRTHVQMLDKKALANTRRSLRRM